METMDTVFFLRAGAMVLLALGSVLVLRVVAQADARDERPRLLTRRPKPAPDAPDPLRRAA